MSRQVGSLHRSNSHTANLQNPLPFVPLFAFPPPDSPQANTSSGMNSDTNSDITIYTTVSQINNSDNETPDEFANSEPSPSAHTPTSSTTFSKPPFRPIQSYSQHTSPYTPSQVTPTNTPFINKRSTLNSPDNIQLSEELDKLITLQQQLLSPHTLTIYQLSSTITSSNPPTPSLAHSSTYTKCVLKFNRAYRTFKRKFLNQPFPSKHGTAREYINHPDDTNATNFLQIILPSFPQYTLNQSNSNTEPRHFVDEHVLIPTLHWTAYYNFSNPLTLPLYNTTIDIERKKDELFS